MMAFERFTKEARAVVLAAASGEATSTGADTIEAEHMLLALSTHPALMHLGLDHDRVADALAREEERSLAAVGVAAADHPSTSAPAGRRRPKLATSSKLALQRGLLTARRRGDRQIEAHHLLLGVLAAEHGRVPRALEIAGIDRAELRARL
jgi:ATP-dependent Clp protease ATP-binding subunit ClpA